jgi:16S rRNA (guanine966-N2)-methyltransferase
MAALSARRYAAVSMTRIIAGFAGSLTLHVPRSGTRPTSDRVREAIFSALESRDAIEGASVVDLYAGSGALGLEAASRGAAEVVLVERAKPAAEVCKRNADAISRAARGRSGPRIRVVPRTVGSYLESAAPGIDLAFIDPPYELGESALARDLELLAPLLDDDAIVVVERSARSPEPLWPAGLEVDRRRDYGETTLWWATAATATPAEPNASGPQPVRPSQPE